MFLEVVQRRNPYLIDVAINLHRNGIILPDTYVLDLDSIIENTKVIKEQADKYNIELFYMTKQFGRNPLVAQAIRQVGIEKAVVVDYKEALALMEKRLPIGHIGHLVQVPHQLLKKIINYKVDYITVFSYDSLILINEIAKQCCITQKILIKIIDDKDIVYDGQCGGFSNEELLTFCKNSLFQKLTNIKICGITSFPCMLFDGSSIILTPNCETMYDAKKILREYNIDVDVINMPSMTCAATLPHIAKMGGTQGEPGHALTGTTPAHAKFDLPEVPSMVYVSEVSHQYNGNSYIFGGGYYRRGHFYNAQVVAQSNERTNVKVLPFNSENIDYYLALSGEYEVGSTVISSFRTQIFVTRSDVAVISGIQTQSPKLEGIYNSQGALIRR